MAISSTTKLAKELLDSAKRQGTAITPAEARQLALDLQRTYDEIHQELVSKMWEKFINNLKKSGKI